MDRTLFYDKQDVSIDGGTAVPEFDYLDNNLSFFVMNYEPTYYTVKEDDLSRPDLISFKTYSTVNYWWLICYVNEVHNPFVDIYVGKLMIIPSILDIYDFYKKYRIVR